jgi:S-adenosylmethionine:tRNA ribosyltransferase-isomerase
MLRRVAAYDYDLPDALIAREPAPERAAARLLEVPPDGESPLDHHFSDLPALLRAGDVLVLNETRVVRARLAVELAGERVGEVLLLRPEASAAFDPRALSWLALVRPGKRLRVGDRFTVGGCGATVTAVLEDGPRVVQFDAGVHVGDLLERAGEVPLPPYVGQPPDVLRQAQHDSGKDSGRDPRAARYQTVFARVPGSVAAPTASLHFTQDVLAAVRARGVTIVPLVLDVGIGTFRPMSGETIDEHVMHAERYAIPAATAAAINEARSAGRRIIAAGTTVLRALEGAAAAHGDVLAAGEGETALFVTPGFAFRIVDALITNFHLPRSTLLVLVSAFAGYDVTARAYQAAIERGYRFFSFGDAMFVQRNPL